jgi:hypothetical protein
MMFALFIALFAADNAEYFEMVEERQAQGHTWHYVGRTVVTDEIALPAVEEDGTRVYYWEIKDETTL